MTYIVALLTAIIYARWIGQYDNPLWFRAFIGIAWGIIAVYAVMC